MGKQATGGEMAVPIFTEFMDEALKGKPPTPFNMPGGMTQVWIDPATGVKANGGEAAIYEAFKPGTGPNLVTSVIGVDSERLHEHRIGPEPPTDSRSAAAACSSGIVLWPDQRLTRKAEPRPVDEALRAIGERLRAAADAAGAYGLAAVHIGAVAPVAVISTAADPDKRDYLVLFNPEILSLDGDGVEAPEGSVSMPGLQAQVCGPTGPNRLRRRDGSGTRSDLEGLPARIAQHEIDQVNGVFFLDRLSRLKRDMVIKKWRKRADAKGMGNLDLP